MNRVSWYSIDTRPKLMATFRFEEEDDYEYEI